MPVPHYTGAEEAQHDAAYGQPTYSQQPSTAQPWPEWSAGTQPETATDADLQLPDWLPQDQGNIQYGEGPDCALMQSYHCLLLCGSAWLPVPACLCLDCGVCHKVGCLTDNTHAASSDRKFEQSVPADFTLPPIHVPRADVAYGHGTPITATVQYPSTGVSPHGYARYLPHLSGPASP